VNNQQKDNFWLWLARHMPKKLVYWCAIVLMAHATTGENSNVETSTLTCIDALKSWERR
jgi:hypothetical protein